MAAKTYTATELAKELGVSPKVLRAYLRKEFARSAVAKKARAAFAKNRAGSK